MPLTKVGFTCTLPVSTYVSAAQGGHQQGEFIHLPDDSVNVDPNGLNGVTYDRVFSKWLTVDRSKVSPDGQRYIVDADTQDRTHVRIVSVSTGQATLLSLPSPGGPNVWSAIDFTSNGIFLEQGWEGAPDGIWKLDPDSGTFSRIASVQWPWAYAGDGAFWFGATWPDTTPAFPLGYTNQLLRLDSATGAQVQYLYVPDHAVSLIGTDGQGHPFVWVGTMQDRGSVELVTAPGKATVVGSGEQVGGWTGGRVSAVTDSHGVWLSGLGGMYLLSPTAGLIRVSDQPGNPAGSCA